MVQKNFCILLEEGRHLRPAGIFCSETAKFSSKIQLKSKYKEVNGKSLLAVISAMVRGGDIVTLSFEGEDEVYEAEKMARFMEEQKIGKEISTGTQRG